MLVVALGEVSGSPVLKADAVELRLDLFPCVDLRGVEGFLKSSARLVMLTLRKSSQGGKFQGSESDRELLIEQLLRLKPHFFDLEYDMRPEFLRDLFERYPKTKFVLSYHNFQGIPFDLATIYRSMETYEAFSYKLAVMVHSTNDALKMLLFAKTHPKASVICMGEKGAFARVLGPIVGNLINYARPDGEKETGPGQLTMSELVEFYRYRALNGETAIYSLIGDPVEKSVGHLYHNEVFCKRNLNAVYVKMSVTPEELSEFIPLAKAIGIRGLSVTMPLKEKIVPFLDEIEPAVRQIGAVNTVLFKNDRLIGTNTDGFGALDAIEKKCLVRGKKIVLLGAGGAARAIAFEAKARGADLLILNRTVERAKALALEVGCEAGGLDEMFNAYDVLINCTPEAMPIDPNKMIPETVAMDIVYTASQFLAAAAARRCQIVYGEEMFVNQAARQTAFWMGSC